MKQALILMLLPASVWAECVLQDRIVQRSQVVIAERSQIQSTVVPASNGNRKCMVNFRARVGADWHTAFGEHEWPGDRPREEACAVAMSHADAQVRERVGRSQTASERVLICNDNPDLNTLRQTNPGTVGRQAQFRPHPDRPRLFWHNGAQCRYFLDSAYTGSDIRTWQGIICQLQGDAWVVVDKF
jgi:hypothetical protein